ncbi:glutathione S-transferase family protein [Microvirga sp. ACRRW]|uniref:glutathione S-transferase family protein n=1 Tax=Microvirga sp. ACRRW TaxID=2918205 RepID=UPI001EF54D3D|nr:glutathione S-transferase family protein [Microvirga sp. ACRRW]MCG7393958.1 glutathione S-transferase family protein [Microvirga sp. ACRRW]
MPSLVLYGNRESGHSYKVRLALTLLELEHEYRPIDLTIERNNRPPDFREVSRFGEVPVLVTNGEALVQSNAILMHLARTTGQLRGECDPDRTMEWMFWEANRITFSISNLRFARRFTRNTPPDVIAWLEARARADLDRLDEEFRGKDTFLLGSTISIADIACCSYLFWPEQAGLDYSQWPHVTAWLNRIRAVPGWTHPYVLMG